MVISLGNLKNVMLVLISVNILNLSYGQNKEDSMGRFGASAKPISKEDWISYDLYLEKYSPQVVLYYNKLNEFRISETDSIINKSELSGYFLIRSFPGDVMELGYYENGEIISGVIFKLNEFYSIISWECINWEFDCDKLLYVD